MSLHNTVKMSVRPVGFRPGGFALDATMAIAALMYEEFKEPLYAAPPLLLRMVDAGLLGRKSGRFYEYGN
jgi:3-hydroxyacyl-CoA dehydrogenase